MIRRWTVSVMKYHSKIANVAIINYKKLPNTEFIKYLQQLKVAQYRRNAIPKDFDYRAFELHSLERIKEDPKLIIDFIVEYLSLNKGTEQGLREMYQVIVDHFDVIARDPYFDSLLYKLSSWTMASNQELLSKTCNYLNNSL